MEKKHEVLFNQLESYREYTLHLLDSVTEEEADAVPDGFNNNIRWNLGHIYLDQFDWIQHLTKEKINIPEGFREWFGFGTSPADWKEPPPTLETLKELLGNQIACIRDQYGHRLEEQFPETECEMHTIAQVLVRTVFHEGLHIGAIISIKKFL
ncbi:DinB family protein [Pseudalkalibacillus caeni]|uniref:DinB family protein n=1 Tax=Exobacillus caeni TaxID=2574798 RepID=A0A5R9F3A5_9BACL|nr:DinB family protein [Pseudalkalibacillus caeni]TLS36058.1 DinB family protein [Pseudalkalibacillus caeni]